MLINSCEGCKCATACCALDSVVSRAADVQRESARHDIGIHFAQPAEKSQQPAAVPSVPDELLSGGPRQRARRDEPAHRRVAGAVGGVAFHRFPVPSGGGVGGIRRARPPAGGADAICRLVQLRSVDHLPRPVGHRSLFWTQTRPDPTRSK